MKKNCCLVSALEPNAFGLSGFFAFIAVLGTEGWESCDYNLPGVQRQMRF